MVPLASPSSSPTSRSSAKGVAVAAAVVVAVANDGNDDDSKVSCPSEIMFLLWLRLSARVCVVWSLSREVEGRNLTCRELGSGKIRAEEKEKQKVHMKQTFIVHTFDKRIIPVGETNQKQSLPQCL